MPLQVHTGRSSKSNAGPETRRMVQGMQGLVRQTREMYAEGIDSRRLLLQQSLTFIESGQGASPRMDESSLPPTVKVLQRQTLLIIITFEVPPPGLAKCSYRACCCGWRDPPPPPPSAQGAL